MGFQTQMLVAANGIVIIFKHVQDNKRELLFEQHYNPVRR